MLRIFLLKTLTVNYPVESNPLITTSLFWPVYPPSEEKNILNSVLQEVGDYSRWTYKLPQVRQPSKRHSKAA